MTEGRALGAAGALAFTAAFLFWVASKLGRREDETGPAAPDRQEGG